MGHGEDAVHRGVHTVDRVSVRKASDGGVAGEKGVDDEEDIVFIEEVKS